MGFLNQIWGIVARPMGYLLMGIYEVVGNYGITLILFTLIVKTCLFPLYANQTKHTMRMGEVQPKMQALQKKYAHDKEELQRRTMELYKEENFNPMRGCLPMLIQMPILLGLFMLLRDPATYLPKNAINMIFASHESFLWVDDLSNPDLWILPIAAGVTTFFSFTFSQSQGTAGGENQMAGMMKMMRYFMPLMIIWMGRSFPAGLALYWFISTLYTIGQNQVLKIWRKKLEKMMAEGKGDSMFKNKKPRKPGK